MLRTSWQKTTAQKIALFTPPLILPIYTISKEVIMQSSLTSIRSLLFFGTVCFWLASIPVYSTFAKDDSKILLQIPAIISGTNSGSGLYGEAHAGQYHLGPVDFAETTWHNACAPAGGYRNEIRQCTGLNGEYLAGVSFQYNEGGGVCDRCIFIKTAMGKSIIARVVTYGATNQPGDIDVSPSVYAALNKGEYPRNMTWQFAKCPEIDPIYYEFQTEAHIWWSSLWVRNTRMPIEKVEVKSSNHLQYYELQRGPDGTITDSGGFGGGLFTLRTTAIDGQVLEDSFLSFPTGELIRSSNQFK
jgi:hypothetical protein